MNACLSSSSSTNVTKRKTRPRKISFTDDEPNYEDFSLVWLDEKRDQAEIPIQLRSVINYLKHFHSIEQCVKYVTSITSEKIFLIIPDTLSKNVIPRVHDHSHLEHIYIYCRRRIPRDLSVQSYTKVSGIFSDNELLMTKLKEDYEVSSHNLCSTSVIIPEKKKKNNNNTDLKNSTINWFPFLIETVTSTPQSDFIKKSLLSKCELDYIDNELEQQSIEDFRKNYQSTDVLSWYKRDCFMYRLLRKAFRSENITTLFKFRFFLTDMHCQLEKLHAHYIDQLPFSQNHWIFYRGQGINTEEFNKIKANAGKLISINTFFVTTTNFETALSFATKGERNSSNESIIFEIVVHRSIAKLAKPFAAISQGNDENEILFSPGTIFQNELIEQHDTIWRIRLTLVNEKHTKEINQYNELLARDYDHASPLTGVGSFLWKIGKYNDAEHIFTILFQELRSLNSDQISYIYNDIGLLYSDRSYCSKALEYFEKSLQNAKKNRTSNISHIGTVLNNIGLIFANKKKYSEALKHYKEALQMQSEIEDIKPSDVINMATIYANVGCVYADMHLFSQALINLEKALDIRQKELPANHPHIAQSYNYIGYVYFLQGFLNKALKTYQAALDINLTSLSNNHVDLLKTYKNIGAVHFGEQKYLRAIEYYEKAIEIGVATLPADHQTMIQLFMNTAYVYKATKDHSMALKYFRKVLTIEKNRSKLNHAFLFEIYGHVGNAYEALSKNSMALTHYKAGLKHGFTMKNQNFSRILTIQGALQRCINREDYMTKKNAKKKR